MSLNLENSVGLNHVGAVASAGAALTGLSGAATTYSAAIFSFSINNQAYNKTISTTVASPTTDGVTATAAQLGLSINQARCYVWGVNAAGTVAVFGGQAVAWPNASGTATGAPVVCPDPTPPSTFALFARHTVANGSNGAAFVFGTTNWNATGVNISTIQNLAGGIPPTPLTV